LRGALLCPRAMPLTRSGFTPRVGAISV
jgi:hypothetical protein